MLCTYLLLFNCQGSIASTFCVESFVIIPHLFRFVNTFLKSFLIFFMVFNFALFRGSRAFCTQLAYYITLHPLCQYLFEKFFKKFFNLSHNLSDRQGCVLYIKPCSTQLDYYSTIMPICQHIFRKFFTFVALHYLTNLRVSKWLLCTKSLQKIQVFTS